MLPVDGFVAGQTRARARARCPPPYMHMLRGLLHAPHMRSTGTPSDLLCLARFFAIPYTHGAQNVAGSTTPGAEPVPGLPALGRQVTSPQDLHDEDMGEGKAGGGQGSGDAAAGGGATSPFTFRIGGAAEVSEGRVGLATVETHEGETGGAHVGLGGGSRQHFTAVLPSAQGTRNGGRRW